jgi:hypothetical protein
MKLPALLKVSSNDELSEFCTLCSCINITTIIYICMYHYIIMYKYNSTCTCLDYTILLYMYYLYKLSIASAKYHEHVIISEYIFTNSAIYTNVQRT